MAKETLSVRAIKTEQGDGTPIFAFFIHGSDITRIADIARLRRDEQELKGFQRGEIKAHVNSIVQFLDSGKVLFPNAIILALSKDVEFASARGRKPGKICEVGDAGTLTIPIHPIGQRAAWIVDGQQRSLALARSTNKSIAVPVIGFVSDDIEAQREQFILVNKAKPLPKRLIDELLPEISVLLPRDLAARQLPSALCEMLNSDKDSPFFGLIKRESNPTSSSGIVADSALIEAMRLSLKSPSGALGQFKRSGEGADANGMYDALVLYWRAVRDAFPEAWGKPTTQSRLMHSAGIRAMGALMDQIMLRTDGASDRSSAVLAILKRLAPHCHWTSGRWEEINFVWNEVQSTSQHISKLTEHLMHLERDLARGGA
jgi:DGQHR domain-containing protein